MTEDQAKHQRWMEKAGFFATFCLVAIVLVGGIVLIALDKQVSGLIALVTAVVALGGLFGYDEKQKRDRRREMRDATDAANEAAGQPS